MKKPLRAFQSSQEPVAVLDLGTSKISCFIAKQNQQGDMEILGIGHQLAEGIRAGNITNMAAAERCISAAVSAAEKMADINVDKVMVGLAGNGVQSSLLKVETETGGREVGLRDMVVLLQKAQEEVRKSGDQALHTLPLEYALDGRHGVSDPRGMFGHKLEAVMHVMRVEASISTNIIRCLAKCHLDIEAYVSSPYAAGLACLNEDDKKLGTLVLDMGAGQTSFAIFKGEEMVYADSIPVGGMHITNDIALGLETDIASAERIKTLYGNVVSSPRDEQELIDVPQKDGGNEDVAHVQRATLVRIIQPRVEEMFELVKQKLSVAGYGRMGGRLVVTGGASQLAGVRQFAGHVFGKRAVRGVPREIKGSAESTSGPAFSVCVGMLDYVKKQRELEQQGLAVLDKKGLKVVFLQFGQWLKENF